VETPSPEPTATPNEPGGGTSGILPPGSFASGVPKPENLGTDPTVVGQSLLLALLFLLLAAFPSQLFNKTVEENYLEIVGWFTKGGKWAVRAKDALASFWKSPFGIFVFIVLSALLYGFLSPQFGPTVESLVSLVGILAGLVMVVAAFELPLVFFQRRLLQDRGRLRVQPLTIFVGIACVVLSRIADFQPGYLYGLVAGYEFARQLSTRDEGRANAITGLWMLSISLVAFFVLPVAESALVGAPLAQVAVAAAMATVFIGGLEGLLFELVPLRFLRGEAVFAWNRILWAILFLAAAFTFAHILLTPASGYLGSTRTSPLFAAIVLFVGFGIVSVLFWGYFRFRPQRMVAG
jgi:hypothetical protein